MPYTDGDIFKDFLFSALTLANDEFTDNESLISCLNRFCCDPIKSCMVYETFASIRIILGVIIHLIELSILMANTGTTLAYSFSAPICVCLVILVAFLIRYDVVLAKQIKNGYSEDFDSCCPSTRGGYYKSTGCFFLFG